MKLEEIWAKTEPFQSVVTHGVVSGVVAQELFRGFLAPGIRERLCRCMQCDDAGTQKFVGYLTSLHDLGKINPFFQAKDTSMARRMREEGIFSDYKEREGFRHEQETALAIGRIWEPILGRSGARQYADILGAHHQGKERSNAYKRMTSEGIWADFQVQFEETMRNFFQISNIPTLNYERKSDKSAVRAVLLGVVILADWISSGAYFADAEGKENLSEYIRMQMQVFLRESGLGQTPVDFGTEFCQVWPNIPAGGERELQRKTQELFDGCGERYSLLLMEAPMGEGKTEAGVYGALQMAQQWGKNGFYVALPTSATANQMVERMHQLLQMHDSDDKVRLLHGTAWMQENPDASHSTEDERFAQQWLSPLRRGLLAPFAVGTVDQAMMAAMFVKYGVLRLLGLAEKTLIIDEIHAYDTYMQNILEGLLEWCKALEIPVVLLSATLPPEKKQRLLGVYTQEQLTDAYPAITAITESGKVHTKPIRKITKRQSFRLQSLPILNDTEEIARRAVGEVSGGGCLCVLMNTVGQAQQVYRDIRDSGFDGTLRLFHSRFTQGRRQEIEKECIRLFGKDKSRRPQKAILVATQVVEQSLDVDFDYFYSAVAPIDLLIQRMGRQFRHGDTPRPAGCMEARFTVLVPEEGSFRTADRYVYPECLLKQTMAVLEPLESIRVPEDIAGLVADGYDSRKVPAEELEHWLENLVAEEIRGAAADAYKLGSPEKKFRPFVDTVDFDDLESQSYLSAQTRLSEPTVTVALVDTALYQRVASVKWADRELAREIRIHSASVRKTVYDKALEKHPCPVLTGDGLLFGVCIMDKDNACFRKDRELGLLEKEEEHDVSL